MDFWNLKKKLNVNKAALIKAIWKNWASSA